MDSVDFSQILSIHKEKGYITKNEVLDLMPDSEDPDALDKYLDSVLCKLKSIGLHVVEEVHDIDTELVVVEYAPDEVENMPQELSSELIQYTDIQRIFYRDIRGLTVLTRDEEFSLFENLEQEKNNILDILASCAFLIDYIHKSLHSAFNDSGSISSIVRSVDEELQESEDEYDSSVDVSALLSWIDEVKAYQDTEARKQELQKMMQSIQFTHNFMDNMVQQVTQEVSDVSALHKKLIALMTHQGVSEKTAREVLKKQENGSLFLNNSEFSSISEEAVGIIHDLQSKEALYGMTVSEFRVIGKRLFRSIRTIESLKNEIVSKNIRLVMSIARRFNDNSMSFMDLVQEGTIGLIKAVDMFEKDRGNKFSTYATWWIRQAIHRGLAEHSKTIRVPIHVSDASGRMKKVFKQLYRVLDREPTIKELADALSIPESKVDQMMRLDKDIESLDNCIGDDESTTLKDVLSDETSDSPFEQVYKSSLKQSIHEIIQNSLNPREAKVIRMRYGINSGEYTLEEIGTFFGITRERVRQIEAKALRKMRFQSEIHKVHY